MNNDTNEQQNANQSATIRRLNDQLRTTFTGGRVMLTRGLKALGPEAEARVLNAVRAFTAFTKENDPWCEHDMGALDVEVGTPGEGSVPAQIFFKIDYYDPTLTMHADDPADPAKTMRVMTIMLADEY